MSDQRRRFDDRQYVHFVTFSVDRRRRLLDLDPPKRIVLGVLSHLLKAMDGRWLGFVVMPDHVHALIWLPQPQDLTRFLHGWRRMSRFCIRRWYAAKASNYFAAFGPGERFWQPKSYVFHIYSQRKLNAKLDDMHLNPVRAGLVARADQWPWSSARWYIQGRSVCVPIRWVE